MISIPLFEWCFTEAYINLFIFIIFSGNFCTIDDVGCEALSIKEACVLLFPAIASITFLLTVTQYFLIVGTDDLFHIVHTTVTNFDIIAVEDFVISMFFFHKCLQYLFRLRNFFATLVFTFLLNGGLHLIVVSCFVTFSSVDYIVRSVI